ncbi:MAG: arsenite methyltransferase [Bacteroidetes bacterium]|nr:arsenite methyltransferase [Bacteroidota bacterium]
MKTPEELKEIVKQKYAEIASQTKESGKKSCCGGSDNTDEVFNIMGDEYQKVDGYYPEADMGLGCGLPTAFAGISPGDTVVDLGSGAGNDCFVARKITGPKGKVTGIDFTPEMIEKARENCRKLGYDNVEFHQGDIEKIPLEDGIADVVISNCVLNLVPDKKKAFSEIYRILKNEGHFCVSDIVLKGELPKKVREAASMYAGCISGALQKNEYLGAILDAGFFRITIHKEKAIELPDEVLQSYLSKEEIESFRKSGTGIFSITVNGEKPHASIAGSACGCGC